MEQLLKNVGEMEAENAQEVIVPTTKDQKEELLTIGNSNARGIASVVAAIL